jgi:hypothetical protein
LTGGGGAVLSRHEAEAVGAAGRWPPPGTERGSAS